MKSAKSLWLHERGGAPGGRKHLHLAVRKVALGEHLNVTGDLHGGGEIGEMESREGELRATISLPCCLCAWKAKKCTQKKLVRGKTSISFCAPKDATGKMR